MGGGSLKNRLGAAVLCSLSYQKENKLILLGDSKGKIHIYRRNEKNIEYLNIIEYE